MAYPDLTGAVNWSTCNGGSVPGSTDTLYLNTGCVLTLDLAAGSTYTCTAVLCATSAAPTTYNQSATIATAETGTGPNLNFAMRAGTVAMLVLAAGKVIANVKKVTGGSASNAYGINNSGTITTVLESFGGTSGSAHGIFNQGAIGTITANGGTSSGYGLYNNGNTTTVGTLTCTGGGAATNYGCYNFQGAVTTLTCTGGAFINAIGFFNNNGPVGTIISATGGSGQTAYGIQSAANTITTINTCTGGSGLNAHGVFNQSSTITNAIGTAKGGSGLAAFGIVSVPQVTITTVDNSANSPGVGVIHKLPMNAWLGSLDAAGTANQRTVPIHYTRKRGALR